MTEKNYPLGACTWIFGDLPLDRIAAKLSGLEYQGVELMGDLSRYTAGQARQVLDDHGLAVFSLTPDNVDLAHPDAEVRAGAVDYYHRLLDFAAELGQPRVSCHGLVGRVAPLASMQAEMDWLIAAVKQIADAATQRGLEVVFEVLNRYETHTVRTGREALDLVERAGRPNLGVLLDAYHMNIEEPRPADAIRQVGDKLWLYHAADSNREGIGLGHTDFQAQLRALHDIDYQGPVIIECTAPGPNPFTPIKDENSLAWLDEYLARSQQWFGNN